LLEAQATASEMHEMLKTAFSGNAMERTQTLSYLLNSNVGKLWLKIVSIQLTLHRSQKKM
jgi:hypothetical protein